MHPAGYSGRPSTAPSGAYGNGGAGSRNGNTNALPYHQPPQQQQQMTPQQREDVLMAAGRLAAEYLVSTGELLRHVLQNRPPAPPLPFQGRRPQHDQTTFPRPFHQDRPLVKQHFQFRPAPAPRQFQQRPFAPRPFQGQGRPIAKRPRPFHPGRFQGRPPFHSGSRGTAPSDPGHGAAPAGRVTQLDLNGPPAEGGDNRQPAAQSGGTAQTQSPQMDQPNQG